MIYNIYAQVALSEALRGLNAEQSRASRRHISPHQKLGCEGEWRPRELGFVHEGNGSGPVAVAVEERADNATIDDAWKAHCQVTITVV